MDQSRTSKDDYPYADLQKAARSETGQKLLSMLSDTNSEKINETLSQANAGNYSEVRRSLEALLADPAIRSLAMELRRQLDG